MLTKALASLIIFAGIPVGFFNGAGSTPPVSPSWDDTLRQTGAGTGILNTASFTICTIPTIAANDRVIIAFEQWGTVVPLTNITDGLGNEYNLDVTTTGSSSIGGILSFRYTGGHSSVVLTANMGTGYAGGYYVGAIIGIEHNSASGGVDQTNSVNTYQGSVASTPITPVKAPGIAVEMVVNGTPGNSWTGISGGWTVSGAGTGFSVAYGNAGLYLAYNDYSTAGTALDAVGSISSYQAISLSANYP